MKAVIVIAIIFILSIVALLVFGGSITPNQSGEVKTEKFDKAPIFTLKDYDGNVVTSSDFIGKLTIINSWAAWCPFCVQELADFADLQDAFPNEIIVIAIDRAESLEKAKGFTDELGVTGRIITLLDPEDSFYKSIGGFSMPETIFVDVDGNIRLHKRGPLTFEEVKKIVEDLL